MSYDDAYERILAYNYDAIYAVMRDPSGDGDFYLELARASGGPVLELGCGTGRILLPIAHRGLSCVGLDASPAMLEVFREKSPPLNVELIEGKMESLDLGERRFPLITIPFRALSHLLEVDTQLAALRRVRAHLTPDGLLAFDVFDPKLERMAVREEPEQLAATFTHQGRTMRRWDTVVRDHSSQVMTLRCRFEGEAPELCGSTEVRMRWFFRYELEHLLARAGFTELAFYGGFDRSPWQAGRETVVLARAPAASHVDADAQLAP